MIIVYFPCYSNTSEYWNDLGFCMGFIESILSSYTDEVIILGDFNFPCTLSNAAFVRCMDTLKEYSVCDCDEYITGDNPNTYVNEALGHKSLIDHIFMSKTLMVHIEQMHVMDYPSNLSDQLPLVCKLSVDVHNPVSTTHSTVKHQITKVRWVKCNLSDYYSSTDIACTY